MIAKKETWIDKKQKGIACGEENREENWNQRPYYISLLVRTCRSHLNTTITTCLNKAITKEKEERWHWKQNSNHKPKWI